MPAVRIFASSEAPTGVLDDIRDLLNAAFQGVLEEDWEHTLGGWHVVVVKDGRPVSHAAVVPRTIEIDGHPFRTGYAEGVGTAPHAQGHGFGSLAVERVARVIRSQFELGAQSTERHGFFERVGWERWRGPTYVRRADGPARTRDEDDGIMVLRFGLSQHVDLAGSIACEERAGDDW